MIKPILFNIVGASGAGKGILLRSVRDMGDRYISIISKATSRPKQATDGDEIKIYRDGNFPIKYDIIYGNYQNKYGIPTSEIWKCFRNGKHAFLICSNFKSINKDGIRIKGFNDAIPKLKSVFGNNMKLIYLYSPSAEETSEIHHNQIAVDNSTQITNRKRKIAVVNQYFYENIESFDHVLLNIKSPEDLSDQFFRLVLHYNQK